MSNSQQPDSPPSSRPQKLRQRAEEKIHSSSSDIASLRSEEVQQLVYELQVHQVELEMQNEELRSAQIELADSRDRYSELYEFAPVAYLTLDKNGEILKANLAASVLVGAERNRLVGKKLESFIAPASQDDYYRHRNAVFASDHKQMCELEVLVPGAPSRFVRFESLAAVVPSTSSRECRIAVIDLTERIHAERERDEQATLARSILDSLTAHVAVINANGEITLVNEAWNKFAKDHATGPTARFGVGANYLDVCRRLVQTGDVFAAKTLRGLRDVLEQRQPEFRLEYPRAVLNGTLWFLLSAVPIVGSGGGAVIAHLDITDRKSAETAAKEGQDKLEAILDTTADAIVTVDVRGIITSANRATERLFGYSSAELVGHNVNMLMPQPYRDEHDGYLARYRQTGVPHIIGIGREVIGQRRDGSTFPVDLAVSAVDHLGLFTGVLRDISERKNLQRHILEVATNEQRRIGQELHDGTQQELTGLTLIAGTLLDILETLPQTVFNARKVRQIEETLFERIREIAASLCHNLADANRRVRDLSHGIMPVQIDAEGLRSALQGLADGIDHSQGIVCYFADSEPVRIANNTTATHLYRIAQEAVNNAIRHSHADQIRISLSRKYNQILLEVSDNGTGLALAAAGSESSNGMGLRTMEYRAGMIGGLLRIERSPEGGTLVRCTIPDLQE